jgi:hypothetical protein
MAVDRRLAELVELLEAATEAVRLLWDRKSQEDEFLAVTNFGAVSIAKYEDMTPNGPHAHYSLTVYNQQGIVIEEFKPTSPDEEALLARLYRLVRRAALNLDSQWSAFLEDLRRKAGKAATPQQQEK